MEISDGYHMKVFSLQVGKHSGEIRELRAVDRKRKLLILEVDVQINRIGWNVVSA